jgi:hypothetical protein
MNEGFHCWEESFPISWDRHDRVLPVIDGLSF